jgi:hypothetical protein
VGKTDAASEKIHQETLGGKSKCRPRTIPERCENFKVFSDKKLVAKNFLRKK